MFSPAGAVSTPQTGSPVLPQTPPTSNENTLSKSSHIDADGMFCYLRNSSEGISIYFFDHSILTSLGEKDLLDITDYLLDMEKSHIYNLGVVLGLKQTKVKTLKDSDTFLDDVITAWLRKEDRVTEKGEPSWTVLVNALKHRRVGQTGIAKAIANNHLGE